MTEKRRPIEPILSCMYAPAGADMPQIGADWHLGSINDIHTMITDGTLAARIGDLHARAQKELGEDCELQRLTVSMQKCFYPADYPAGEIMDLS